jgi:excisionase family DNA binding protein
MKPILSPKELAQAIGVSESSLKRWADDGRIRVARTAGGHRRITINDAIRFIRESGCPVVRPEILGLPDMTAASRDLTPGDDTDRLFEYLREGQAAEARGHVMAMYLSGSSVAAIADGPIRLAMERVGQLWEHDESGIYFEHRATEICVAAVRQLHLALPTPTVGPAAIGGAPTDDRYVLPSLLAGAVLQAEGYRTTNLGPHTPISAFAQAATQQDARLVWMSVSTADSPDILAEQLARLLAELTERGIALTLGGRVADALKLPASDNLHVGHTMAELVAFARGLRSHTPAPPRTNGHS